MRNTVIFLYEEKIFKIYVYGPHEPIDYVHDYDPDYDYDYNHGYEDFNEDEAFQPGNGLLQSVEAKFKLDHVWKSLLVTKSMMKMLIKLLMMIMTTKMMMLVSLNEGNLNKSHIALDRFNLSCYLLIFKCNQILSLLIFRCNQMLFYPDF